MLWKKLRVRLTYIFFYTTFILQHNIHRYTTCRAYMLLYYLTYLQMFKSICCIFKKYIYITDENDPLSEYNKIPLVTIVSMAPFSSRSTPKLRSALHFRYSIVIPLFIPPVILLNPNNH